MKIQNFTHWFYVGFVLAALIIGFVLGYSAYSSYVVMPPVSPVNWAEKIQTTQAYALFAMLILGSVVGLITITRKKIKGFLYATVTLLLAASVNIWSGLWHLSPLLFFWAHATQTCVAAFAVPLAVILAFKTVLDIKKED